MFKELFASILLSGSIGAKSLPVTTPVHTYKESAVFNNTLSLYGVFNLRQYYTFNEDITPAVYSLVLETRGEGTTESPTWCNLCPFAYATTTYPDRQNYLYQIVFDHRYGTSVTIDMYFYDMWGTEDYVSFTYEDGDTLDDLPNGVDSMFFYCPTNILLHDDLAKVFDETFTTEDTDYVVSYTGYYSFLASVSSIPTRICVLGNMLFDNTSCFGFTNYGYNTETIAFLKYSLEYNTYQRVPYSLPFNKNIVSTGNLMMNGCKMSLNTKLYLEGIGYFGYVRDTSYDNVTFREFFFSIVDTPVYFASSLLSFELFGVNLFIALTGLLTLCCILLLIKKFW